VIDRKASATANTGVLRYAQDDDEKLATTSAGAKAKAKAKAKAGPSLRSG
jgi:hypothetical protein